MRKEGEEKKEKKEEITLVTARGKEEREEKIGEIYTRCILGANRTKCWFSAPTWNPSPVAHTTPHENR